MRTVARSWVAATALLVAEQASATIPPPLVEWSERLRYASDPVVVQLTDDDGDGVITACDTPDVVVAGNDFHLDANGAWVDRFHLAALSGADGATIWDVDEPACLFHCDYPSFAPAAGDVDGDGVAEIVVVGAAGQACAFAADGSVKWRTDLNTTTLNTQNPAAVRIVDLEGDGSAEVAFKGGVLEGIDGRIRWTDGIQTGDGILVADIDLDGRQEYIDVCARIREPDGTAYQFRNLT